MSEAIAKWQPHRTMYLQGMSEYGASAAMTQASATGWTVSGDFRDQADFAVAVAWKADDFFGHPRFQYLPDFDFRDMVIHFDVIYSNLQPIDSPKFASINWDKIVLKTLNGDRYLYRMWDTATLASGSFTAASGSFTLSVPTVQAFDRVSLWYQNLAFDYQNPGANWIEFEFYNSGGTGASHRIATPGGLLYEYIQQVGDGSGDCAQGLVDLVNAGAGDPNVIASIGSAAHKVRLDARLDTNIGFALSAADGGGIGGGSGTIYHVKDTTYAKQVVRVINELTDWASANPTFAVMASLSGMTITITSARHGKVNIASDGVSVTWVPPSGTGEAAMQNFTGIPVGSQIVINGVVNTVSAVADATHLTLGTSVGGALLNAKYLAERGGYDGNMLELYSLASAPSRAAFNEASVKLAGGDSDVTWSVHIPLTTGSFTKIDAVTSAVSTVTGCDQDIERMWFTFAPRMPDGVAYADQEWEATFSNLSIDDPSSHRALKVAGPNSVRIEETDEWCRYDGFWEWATHPSSPTSPISFFSGGRAKRAAATDAEITIETNCSATHDIYIGTFLNGDCGHIEAKLDGGSPVTIDTFERTAFYGGEPRSARRKLFSKVTAGKHIVEIRLPGTKNSESSGYYAYFDFLECAVLSDVPDPIETFSDVAPATDYDTNHGYNLPPVRLVSNIRALGLHGEIDHYMGVFWWNQRENIGRTIASATVTFGGTWAAGEAVILEISGATFGKTVFVGDDASTIAAHFRRYINETQVGLYASSSGAVLTITSRSAMPNYQYALSLNTNTSALGTVVVGGSLDNGVALDPTKTGQWIIKPSVSPKINRGARDWHSDYFRVLAAAGQDCVVAFSQELVLPPDDPGSGQVWIQRFPDNTPVLTATGFGTLASAHCAFSPVMRDYMKVVYDEMATLMEAEGLVARLQFGEILWWFHEKSPLTMTGGLALWDDYVTAQATATLGRALTSTFTTRNSDPSVNSFADAIFLRNILRDYVAAIKSYVVGLHGSAKFELLWPLDVNFPATCRLMRYINLPTEWEDKSTSPFDTWITEGYQFGLLERDLDKCRQIAEYPFKQLTWPKADCRYLMGLFDQGWPWVGDFLGGKNSGVPVIKLWAWDHVCLYNRFYPLPKQKVGVKSENL